MTPPAAPVAVRRHPAGHLEARPRRGSGRHGAVLARFLQGDLQGDASAARTLLAAIAAARRGEPPQPEAVGNAFAIRIGATGAMLRHVILADTTPERYSLDEFAAALEAWLAAIAQADRDAR